MDYVLNAGLLALLTAPFVALALWTSKERRWAPAVLFLGLLVVDDLATILPFAFDALQFVDGRWNWEGKMLSIGWAVLFLVFGPLSPSEAGVSFRQRPSSIRSAVLATLGLTAASFGIGFAFGGGSFSYETLAFQATMPGVAEELVYRGLFVALVGRALPSTESTVRWRPIIVTALAFGAWHGLSVDGGQVAFNWLSASFPFVGGIAYGWLREYTGSVLFPALAHNFGNTAAFFGGLIG